MSAAAEAVAEEAPVAEEVVAEEAAKEVEKPAKTVSNTPDPTVSAPQRSLLALLAFHPPVLISLPCSPQEWADRSMVVEDSFYASKPVFLTSVEIGLAEPRAAKIMQRVSRGLLARKKVAVKEEAATEQAATEEAAAKSAAAKSAAAEETAAEEAAVAEEAASEERSLRLTPTLS